MKGVSAVIATILMLMITIALAGTAYMYITGVFQSRTAVVLAISDSDCDDTEITVWVRNDGSQQATGVNVAIDGTDVTCGATGDIDVPAGGEGTCVVTRTAGGSGNGASGYHSIRANAGGVSARGSVYCGAATS
jgi:flagellin-like protein